MIKTGDALPALKLTAATAEGPKEVTTAEVFGGKKVVLFATPGAFTPTTVILNFLRTPDSDSGTPRIGFGGCIFTLTKSSSNSMKSSIRSDTR